ncbi:hypothetical protein K7X08_026244 [Anisodus acutangulus]|uniref:RRM domain-containing protein n=1 Tax=Anisodus acutangulus TaxID=402998 RepID=A0A9Q1N2C6_9SOLA|nr:hypothetical protein K7X08_026244 [Anisodus acutangulus]
MAKKRKTRASEATQQSVEQEIKQEIKQEPVEEEYENDVVEEEEETVQEEDEEEPDPEDDNDEEETPGSGNDEEETPGSGNDAVKSEQEQINGGGEVKKEGDEEYLEDEPLEKLLEPFTKDQLTALIKEALDKYPDFKDNIQTLADKDPAHRKIFVHGLGWDTTAETLTSVFGKYGEIEDCKAVTDKVSGKSKGYAFILFKHRSGARKALREPQKKIGTRMTSCQLASAGPVPAPPPTAAAVPSVSEYTQRKIFVSNVAADLDPQKLLEFFSKFGEVEEGPLGLDKQTGKPKGFCLFVYKSVESARKALEEPHKSFEGHTLHCQKAVDGPKHNKNYYQQHQPQSQQHYPQHHHQQPYYQHSAKKGKYSGGSGSAGGSAGHLMAPSGPAPVGYNPAVAAVTPALGQALTALLATQGASLGIGNLLGARDAVPKPADAGWCKTTRWWCTLLRLWRSLGKLKIPS